MTRLHFDGRLVATAVNPQVLTICGQYKNGEVYIEWRRWRIDELRFSQTTAILFLGGATMQDIVEPYTLLRANPPKPYDVSPGMKDVVLAEPLCCSPKGLSRFELLALLLPEAREG